MENEVPIPIEQVPLKGVSLRTFYTVITSTVLIMLYINNMGNKIDKLTEKVGSNNELMDVKIRGIQQRQDQLEMGMQELRRDFKENRLNENNLK